ncbi:MAG: division plane positioning ATPase MipZ [Rhizobiaceae bacterium]
MAHVIVCGNEKGGSGKSTLSMHIAIALLKAGNTVATMDLDSRQLSLTHYVKNRRDWSKAAGVGLDMPTHLNVARQEGGLVIANEDAEAQEMADRIGEVERTHDFLVIDTPGADTYLQRLAHKMADTLVTPINDSFVDLDVIAEVEPYSDTYKSFSPYTRAVNRAREERLKTEGKPMDWVVVRNRLSSLHSSRNESKLNHAVLTLSRALDFRVADGVSERVVFREFFPIGLTALDEFDAHVLGTPPTMSHLAARQEIRQLIANLKLPTRVVLFGQA